jgi:hypothetical protein
MVTATLPNPARLPPAVAALAIQAVSATAVLAFAADYGLPRWVALAAHVSLVVAFTAVARLPRWWLLIQALLPLLVIAAVTVELNPGWFLAGFVVTASLTWGAAFGRVPLFLTGRAAHEALAARLPRREGARFLDLGSGFGGVLASLSRARPAMIFDGVENAPLSWIVSRLRLAWRGNARVRLASLWKQDLSRYDAVYAYLSPAAMPELWRKVCREMRPGTLFVSNCFAVPGTEADEIVPLDSRNRLYLWRIRESRP